MTTPRTSEARTLEQVIADARGEAAVLRANRASFSVERVEELLADVVAGAEEWLTFLSESDAAIRCGYSAGWLRQRFEGWRREGHARMNGQHRQYRQCIVPRRANTVHAAARGREAARKSV